MLYKITSTHIGVVGDTVAKASVKGEWGVVGLYLGSNIFLPGDDTYLQDCD